MTNKSWKSEPRSSYTAGMLYQKWESGRRVGLFGAERGADSCRPWLGSATLKVVRLLWPTGVPQDEINLAAKKESAKHRRTRPARGVSCPVLFSWNGREVRIHRRHDRAWRGRPLGRTRRKRDVPDPDEYLKVPARQRENLGTVLLSFRFMEPMEKKKRSISTRCGWWPSIIPRRTKFFFPNERFVSAPAFFPEFRVIASRKRTSAHRCVGRPKEMMFLPLISRRDRKYVTSFR